MKRVWVTRTEPGASRLGSFLKSKGYVPFVAPVMEIHATDDPRPRKSIDLWVFVSTHAVGHAVSSGWSTSGKCVAVGTATADALKAHVSDVAVPRVQSTEGLLELIQRVFVTNTSVCIVAGRGGRTDLEKGLREHGYDVNTWLAYKRCPTQFNVKLEGIDAILIGSGAALSPVMDTLRKSQIPCAKWPHIIVPSERIANFAKTQGLGNVFVAQGASKEAVLQALSALDD